jgi:hypothetical protein
MKLTVALHNFLNAPNKKLHYNTQTLLFLTAIATAYTRESRVYLLISVGVLWKVCSCQQENKKLQFYVHLIITLAKSIKHVTVIKQTAKGGKY